MGCSRSEKAFRSRSATCSICSSRARPRCWRWRATPRFRFPQPPSRSTPPGSPAPRTPRSGRNGRACSASSTASILRIAPEGIRVWGLAPPAPRHELSLSARLRLLARGGERDGWRERLGIDLEVEDRGLAGFLRGFERRKEIRGLLHHRAVTAEGARIGRKIRALQSCPHHPAGIVALLVHADGAVHAVVDDDDDHRQAVLHGGCELLPCHQEIAVTGKRDDRALRCQPLHSDGGGYSI